MLADLDSLVAFTHRRASRTPSLAPSILLKRPGLSERDTQNILREFPDMPSSYLAVAEKISIKGISIGYFVLSPGSNSDVDLVSELIKINDAKTNGMASIFRGDGVYQVARWEADPIAIASKNNTFKINQIVLYNSGNLTQRANVIADNFEQFLLLAGTLDEVRDKHRDSKNTEASIKDFQAYVNTVSRNYDDDIFSVWTKISEVVLS